MDGSSQPFGILWNKKTIEDRSSPLHTGIPIEVMYILCGGFSGTKLVNYSAAATSFVHLIAL